MARDMLKDGREGHFFRGNLHCHSNRSDGLHEPEFDLAPFRGSYCRVTVVDPAGRRAWSNPIWP